MKYYTRSGQRREIEQAWGIFDAKTGEQIKPNTKGYAGFAYPSKYSAEQAIAASKIGKYLVAAPMQRV